MAHEPSTSDHRGGHRFVPSRKYLVVAYPAAALTLLFAVPLALLFVHSFYRNVSGGTFEAAFTLANYVRVFTEPLYVDRLLYTLRLAGVTTIGSLVLGYPLAYRLAQMNDGRWRRLYMSTLVSSLWLTFIIRGYAWTVLLKSDGLVVTALAGLGLVSPGTSLVPGYWALVVSMIYVFLPFMVLPLYTSLKNIDRSLIEASKDLGAGPLVTFRRVTLPLSKDGVVSGSLLVFVLSLGVYVLPRLLGDPSQWTLAVLIGNQVTVESNVPFGAALSIVLLVVVVVLVAITVRIADIDAVAIGGESP